MIKSKKNSALKIGITALTMLGLFGCATQTGYMRLDPSLQNDIRTFQGANYIPLVKLCDHYKLECKWDSFIKTATLEKNVNRIVLMADSDRALVNGIDRKLERPVLFSGGVMYVPVSFARDNLAAVVDTVRPVGEPAVERASKFTIRTIVLDAGHGGRDPGCLGRRTRLKEKHMTLSMSKKVKEILEGQGIRVIMTRTNDTFIPLPKRADIANKSGADLFVSMHINASRSRSMRGFECYYLSNTADDNARAVEALEDSSLKLGDDAEAERSRALDRTLWDMALTENRTESAELAGQICASVDGSMLMGVRGVKTARFYVLKHTNMPSVLVESGYISNKYEEMKLQDPNYLDKMAVAVAQGILRYKVRYEETDGFSRV